MEQVNANRASVKDEMAQSDHGLSPAGFDMLMGLATGKQPANPDHAAEFVKMGLGVKDQEGKVILSEAGKEIMKAIDDGDAATAIDLVDKAMKAATAAPTPAQPAQPAKPTPTPTPAQTPVKPPVAPGRPVVPHNTGPVASTPVQRQAPASGKPKIPTPPKRQQ